MLFIDPSKIARMFTILTKLGRQKSQYGEQNTGIKVGYVLRIFLVFFPGD